MQRYPTPMLRADGNLSYLDFVRLVDHMWSQGHPDIPIYPTGHGDAATYPSILYGLELRRTHPSDPKPRFREMLDDSGKAIFLAAQRFQNIISFTSVTEADPVTAEEIIEMFEDFMLEYTPFFKEAGVSELTYARRLPDSEQNRSGQGVVNRTVTYMVTTEKIRRMSSEQLQQYMDRIDEIVAEVRTHKSVQQSPAYSIRQNNISWIGEDSVVTVSNSNFHIGDRVYVTEDEDGSLPDGMFRGFYFVSNVIGMPWSDEIGYTLSRLVDGTYEPVDFGSGSGRVFYAPDSDVIVRAVDEFGTTS